MRPTRGRTTFGFAARGGRACPVCGKIKIGLGDHMRSKHPGVDPAPVAATGSNSATKTAAASSVPSNDSTQFAARWTVWTAQLHQELNVSDVCWCELENRPGQLILLDPTANSTVALLSKINQLTFRPSTEVAKELGNLAERWFQERQQRAQDRLRERELELERGKTTLKVPPRPVSGRVFVDADEIRRAELRLTDFGWHAPESQDRRHAALQSAVSKLGWQEVLKKLGGCRLTNWYELHREAVEIDIRFVQRLWHMSTKKIDWYIYV